MTNAYLENILENDYQQDQMEKPKIKPKKEKKPLKDINKILPRKTDQQPQQHQNTVSDEPIDLYYPDASVHYIKEKYIMYSDWLIRNKTGMDFPNKNKKEIISEAVSNPQLNWYHYEKSVQLTDTCFKFLSTLSRNRLLPPAPTISETNLTKPNPENSKRNKKYHSSMGCYKTTPASQDSIPPRSFSTELKRKDSKSNSQHKLHKNLKNIIQQHSIANEAFIESVDNENSSDELESEPKRSNFRRSSNVIKAGNALMSSRGVKFIKPGDADLETIIEKEKDIEKPKKVKRQIYKLPPIAKCSKDFNAVLEDIQRDEFL